MLNARSIIEHIRHVGFRNQPPVRCDACGRKRGDRRRFIAGPGVMICEECVAGIPAHYGSREGDEDTKAECSFCRRNRVIVAEWPRLRICASCTTLIDEILAEDDRGR